ncbi:MAG TPA: hypothetical protein DEP87_02150, partial [Candidatus Pacebacteria bacterium]|nr:hypothetical protein [Candidatus Paceibacterota bacterium]
KTILVEKLETVVRMLNAESAEQALSGEKRKEIVNLLDEARDAFNKMDFSSLDLYEKLNMGVIEPKWLDKNTNPQV